jgi:hypothetical protein
MLWAAMPKATVYEDSDTVAPEHNVGLDPNVLSTDEAILAKPEPNPMQKRADRLLWSRIRPSVALHDRRYGRARRMRVRRVLYG